MADPKTALIVADMLTSYEFDDAERVAESARDAVPAIADLIDRARDGEAMLVYVNDNYGDWTASSQEIVERALAGAHPELVEPLVPEESDAFVLKARHSAFYTTPLEYMLRQAEIERVVLAGQVTEQCVLYSALDAYVRHFRVAVARDGVAHIEPQLADAALRMVERNMRGDVRAAAEGILAG